MDMILNDSYATLQEYADADSIAVDIETTGLSPWNDQIAVVSIAAPGKKTSVTQTLDGMDSALRRCLTQPREWITHNGTGFDVLFMMNAGIDFTDHRQYDTLIGEQVLSVQNRHDVRKSLDKTMQRRLGKSFKLSIDHETWKRAHLTDEQLKYAAADVEHLHAIKKAQEDNARQRKLLEALGKEQELSLLVATISHTGLAMSREVLDQERVRLYEEAAEAENRLFSTLGKFNVNSPKQVKEAFKNGIGLELPNTQVVTLMDYVRDFPLVEDFKTVRKALKRTGMYNEDWYDEFAPGGRVRARFWQCGTDSLRFSSSRPNLQQIPRDFRHIFGNEPGKSVVQVDYSLLELRVAEWVAGDTELHKALDEEDFHLNMASHMFGKPKEEVSKSERRDGKGATFIWLFGGGPRMVVSAAHKYGGHLTVPQAQQIVNNLNKRFPAVRRYHLRQAALARRPGVIVLELPWGHQRHILPDKTAGRRTTSSINTLIQGRAAIGLKEAVFEMKKEGVLPQIGALVHDEVVATSIPDNEAQDFADALSKAMIRGMEKVTPGVEIKVDRDIGPTWIP